MMRQFEVVEFPVDVPGARLPHSLVLQPASPNPFNPATTVRFELPSHARTILRVFDVRGRRVRLLLDEQRGPGPHRVIWNGRDDAGGLVAAGTYFVELQSGGEHSVRKATVIK